MPKMPSKVQELPKNLRPFRFHGLDFDWSEGVEDVYADCPFCGREGKLGISVETSKWQCLVCTAGGNALGFVRQLWDASDAATTDYRELADDRGLLYPETLDFWGICRSVASTKWLVPGYGPRDSKVLQLYQRVKVLVKGAWKWQLRPTPDLWDKGEAHGLIGLHRWVESKPTVYICESWNAVALWEVLRRTMREDDGGLSVTGSDGSSLLAEANVLGVPGAGIFRQDWLLLCAGKEVVLLYDNDHGREYNGEKVLGGGAQGMKRVAGLLAACRTPPETIRWLKWGKEDGYYDPALPSGYDVRDLLGRGDDPALPESQRLAQRITNLGSLLTLIHPIPEEWAPGRTAGAVKTGGTKLQVLPCSSWEELRRAWRGASRWRKCLEDVLATMLALGVSTVQTGQQLCLQVVGDAGSYKTTLCEAVLTSEYSYLVENITGFFSGWRADQGEDYSLLARANRMLWVTPEGDLLVSHPQFREIMSQMRRIFDGKGSASYKTLKADRQYDGLRTPWIIAGTPAIMDNNQARLGDRFLRICMDRPGDEERAEIIKRAIWLEADSVLQESNGTPDSIMDPRLSKAYRMTGGYLDHLRINATKLLNELDVDVEAVIDHCHDLAEFVADLRARPEPPARLGEHKEEQSLKELPARLGKQFYRLACCIAVATGKREVDGEVLSLVTKVALDTARGKTLDIVRHIARDGSRGLTVAALAVATGDDDARLRALLLFLRRIGTVEMFETRVTTARSRIGLRVVVRWRLTDRFRSLWEEVVGDSPTI